MLKVNYVLGFLSARVDNLSAAANQKGILFYLAVFFEVPKGSGG